MKKKHDEESIEGEVVTDVSEGGEPGGTRKLRVYDHKGDFTIEIPSDAKVTFGYFNPGAPSENQRYGKSDEERRTALRIYKSEKEQLAVFLGVKGFRDESIKLIRLQQRVVVESSYADDGEEEFFTRKSQRQLIAAPEEGTYQ